MKLEHGIFICGDRFTHRVTQSIQGNTKQNPFVPFRQIRVIVFTDSGEPTAWYIYLSWQISSPSYSVRTRKYEARSLCPFETNKGNCFSQILLKLEHGIFICGDKFTHRVTRSIQGNTKPDPFVPFRQIRVIVFYRFWWRKSMVYLFVVTNLLTELLSPYKEIRSGIPSSLLEK